MCKADHPGDDGLSIVVPRPMPAERRGIAGHEGKPGWRSFSWRY